MELQIIFDILIGIVGVFFGWFLSILRDSMKSLQDADTQLTNKVQAIEILVAGEYVKRSDFERKIDAIFVVLDRIENKLARKVDKAHGT